MRKCPIEYVIAVRIHIVTGLSHLDEIAYNVPKPVHMWPWFEHFRGDLFDDNIEYSQGPVVNKLDG